MFAPLKGERAAEAILQMTNAVCGEDIAALLATSPDILQRNAIAQPLICALQLASWAVLAPLLPRPRVFAGYSIGELAAFGCAGALAPESLIRLACRRAAAMDRACPKPNGLIALRGLTRIQIDALCQADGGEIAIINGPDRFVVGGLRENLPRLAAAAAALGGSATPLMVAVASHTSLMAPARAVFDQALGDARLRSPAVPVLAGVDGSPVHTGTQAAAMLLRQMTEPVDWAACLESLSEMGCRVLLELGPGNALSTMAREHLPHIAVRAVDDFKSLHGAAEWVSRQG
jgi:[acyl-carrier-protein] S-malonyltransferase